MKSQEVQQIATSAITDLVAALEAGHTETLLRYLAAMGRFHRYSLHNLLLIALQNPAASYVAGFHTWKRFGRFVRKGEKGIYILAPLVQKQENHETPEADSNSVVFGFRACAVFDYSQTEGKEMPTIGCVEGEPAEYQEKLCSFVVSQGIALAFSEAIAPARGTSEGGKITLLPHLSPAETFATLAHECAHELLHRQANRKEISRRQRETEAEAVAYVVCQAIGLQTGTACQDYIQLHRGDAALLTESLERVRVAASKILTAITGIQAAD
jgi:hypothetical protein